MIFKRKLFSVIKKSGSLFCRIYSIHLVYLVTFKIPFMMRQWPGNVHMYG